MKQTGMVALALLAAAIAGGLIALQFFPSKRTETVTIVKEDTARIAAARIALQDQVGENQDLRIRVTAEQRSTREWKDRAARLAALVTAMQEDTTGDPAGDTITAPIAAITRTVIWPGDSLAAAAIDTVTARYDIARDLWTALQVGYQERRIRNSTSYSTTNTTEGGSSFPFLAVGMTTVIVLLLAIVIGRAVGQ